MVWRQLLRQSYFHGGKNGNSVSRCLSTSRDRLLATMDEKSGVATMAMNKPPVNSLDLDYLREMHAALEKLEADKSCRGLILTSGVPRIFSAGLDITEMYKPQPDRLMTFWRSLQDVWINLNTTRLATIAAINGHSPAGGCLLALSCDYRIMAPGFSIGLNETQLGIAAPHWILDTMRNCCGHRLAEVYTVKGLLLTTEQAHNGGMVDDVIPLERIQEAAETEMASCLKVPDAARHLTKRSLRQATVDSLVTRREEDVEKFRDHIMSDAAQTAIGKYLESLARKKPK